ncbi:MAG TPA: ATP-binding cassette domain-containing protein, partial [Puia sp.]|nr:ATP-binding cassette domain-containing protein [Puia sp.]
MVESILTLEGVTVQAGAVKLLDELDWTIRKGEQWAVVGPSGGGKTVLAHTLLGRHFSTGRIRTGEVRMTIVEQQHRFQGLPGASALYYQQRFNSQDAEGTITVGEELAAAGFQEAPPPATRESGGQAAGQPGPEAEWLDTLGVRSLLQKPLIQLSNGENKRVQLAIAMLERPQILILDNPFLGLDAEGRSVLHTIVNHLAESGTQILLITSEREIPSCITHLARLEKGRWDWMGPRAGFEPAPVPAQLFQPDAEIMTRLKDGKSISDGDDAGEVVIDMRGVNIRYGDALILESIDWQVRRGERWNISGPNGAGKSTLLSLITADNPQAYANKIWLFGRRRGTGESIWDIKRRIGFVSPELHLYFDPGATCFEVVASGLFDTIGLFRTLSAGEEEAVMRWISVLSLQQLRSKRLVQLSAGQQRMVLLARALIKDPPMLILDEPCQGLDEWQTAYFTDVITVLCEGFDRTLLYVSHYTRDLPRCIDKFLR